jgi:DNA-binding CsgD family transcriptional regulator
MRPHPRHAAEQTGGGQQPRAAGEHDSPAATLRTVILDERQRMLVSLLIAGHTDSSAAHRLGISARTVTNILRSLMDRLGVDNRFQLGVALGSRLRHTGRPTQPRPGGVHMGSVRRSQADQLRDRGYRPAPPAQARPENPA